MHGNACTVWKLAVSQRIHNCHTVSASFPYNIANSNNLALCFSSQDLNLDIILARSVMSQHCHCHGLAYCSIKL